MYLPLAVLNQSPIDPVNQCLRTTVQFVLTDVFIEHTVFR